VPRAPQALALALAAAACSSSSPPARPAAPAPALLHVRSTPKTNGGKTLYVMVREADAKSITLGYDEAAAKLFADPPDPAVVASRPLFPGTELALPLEGDGKKDLVVYFFFTEPSTRWRLPLRKPLPSAVYVDLGVFQIEKVQRR
jgi:intracellular growth IglE-like protein